MVQCIFVVCYAVYDRLFFRSLLFRVWFCIYFCVRYHEFILHCTVLVYISMLPPPRFCLRCFQYVAFPLSSIKVYNMWFCCTSILNLALNNTISFSLFNLISFLYFYYHRFIFIPSLSLLFCVYMHFSISFSWIFVVSFCLCFVFGLGFYVFLFRIMCM